MAYTGDGSPFKKFAKYIGLVGEAENEGVKSMAMTLPVATSGKGGKTVKFFLPAEYDSIEKIPKPTDSAVHIAEVPPQVGVVHRYSGSLSEQLHVEKAKALSAQLREDGIDRMTEAYVLQHYQFWGFNPPFTIPMFRRNEVWLELTPEEVEILQKKFKGEELN